MIKARVTAENPNANLKAYYDTYTTFDWSEVKNDFFITENDQINIAWEMLEKWNANPDSASKIALIFQKNGIEQTFTYKDLKERSSKWATLLCKYSYKIGDRIFILLNTCPDMYFIMLACARLGLIFSIVMPSLSTEEIEILISDAEPRGIVTDTNLIENLPKTSVDCVFNIFLVDGPKKGIFNNEVEFEQVIAHIPEEDTFKFVSPETPLYICYTSGATGPPKGIVHAHEDMYGIYITSKYVLDLNESSIIWTDSEPAWITGTVYGCIGPWLIGATAVIDASSFSPEMCYRTLEKHNITTWYTTPITIRKIVTAAPDLHKQYDLTKLQHIVSTGETLVPELFYWMRQNLNHSAHDTWWMTETGIICMANFPSQYIKPGSMGRPVPGIEVAVIDSDGEVVPILTLGELAIKTPWPGILKAVWKNQPSYDAYFRNGWFITGDMVIKDEDGYFYFVGRNDYCIKLGPSMLGPFDFEQILRLHEYVEEVAVISNTTEPGTAFIKAFVKLIPGIQPTDQLKIELIEFMLKNFRTEIPEFQLTFIDELPKTKSGKILRRVLWAQELGLPSGDPLNLQD